MRFYLGTHEVPWLGRTDVPLFISRRRLTLRRRLPRALGPWALDSGGFTELSMHGEWRTSADAYVHDVLRFAEEVGNLEWAAPRDWMCEPWIVERTGLSVREHQERTVADFLDLRSRCPLVVPVLQGWTPQEYEDCALLYEEAGVNLRAEPVVGLGSICRRQTLQGGREVVSRFAAAGVRIHGFGLKLTGLREMGWLLASSDSMAWSYSARHDGQQPGCSHQSCANCIKYAMRWRERVLDALRYQQPTLGVA